MLKGYLSKEWRELASMPMLQGGKRDEAKGTHRMRMLLDIIHSHCIRLWKSRNEALHDKSDADLSALRSSETAEITQLYSQPDQMCYSDRYLCARPLEQLLRSTPATRRRWLRRVKASRDLHIRDGSRQVLITAFLHPLDLLLARSDSITTTALRGEKHDSRVGSGATGTMCELSGV